MPAAVEQHHHRSTTKVSHKPFKPRFTSKNALKDRAKGKVESLNGHPRKTRHQEVMSKFDRKNQAKQKRLNKQQDHLQTTNIFGGRDGASRIIAMVPLCDDISTSEAVHSLNKSIDLETTVLKHGLSEARIDRFKQKLQYVIIKKDLLAALNACRSADYVVFVLSAKKEVDDVGETIIRCVEGQGVSQVYTVVQGLDQVQPVKKRAQVVSSLKSFISHFFPYQEKIFSLDSAQECQNLLRSLCTTTPKGIKWRDDRSWMVVESARLEGSLQSTDRGQTGTAVFTGVIRGKRLKADRLLQVGDWGDFRVEKIMSAPVEQSKSKPDTTSTSEFQGGVLDQPSQDQESLEELAPEDTLMSDIDIAATTTAASERRGVLLDDHHYFSEHEAEEGLSKPKRIPRGTSKYQSAWYLGDMSDSGSDLEDVDDEMEDAFVKSTVGDDFAEARSIVAQSEQMDAAPSEYPQSEPFNDVSPQDAAEAAALAEYRESKKQKSDAEEDLVFPDEIELHPNVQARERLARYRGLRSAKTSPWLTEEDAPHQPNKWPRLLEVHDYKGARSRVLREALVGGVEPGTRVHIYVQDVPQEVISNYGSEEPLTIFSLLRHEHKRAPVDVSITLDSEYPRPIKSKEELIVQIGSRRLVVNPLFSQGGNTSNDVHKFERFLHPNRMAVASFVGPMMWGSVPALFFKRVDGDQDPDNEKSAAGVSMEVDEIEASQPNPTSSSRTERLVLVGRGTLLPSTASSSRVIAKRIILTGQPFKIHKRVVTVRYMFFNRQDVEWFRALRLFMNKGRQGVIKEALGTHGYFKAEFDAAGGRSGAVGKMESVGIALWKRVWPKNSRMWNTKDYVQDDEAGNETGNNKNTEMATD